MNPLTANTSRPRSVGVSTDGAWNDLQGAVSEGAAGAALEFEAFRDTPFKLASFRNAQNDELHMTFQMSHGWKPGTVVRPHLHVIPLAAAAGTVHFTGYYAWALYGQEVPALTGWTAFTIDYEVLASEVNKSAMISLGDVTPPAGVRESDFLLIYFKREGGAAEDDYVGNLAALGVDCHYQIEKDGTDAEMPGA